MKVLKYIQLSVQSAPDSHLMSISGGKQGTTASQRDDSEWSFTYLVVRLRLEKQTSEAEWKCWQNKMVD